MKLQTPSTPSVFSNSSIGYYPRSTGQERRNKLESSAAKASLLTSSGAREQESEQEKERKQECKSKSARARARVQEKEQEQESKREKKNGKTPSLLRRIILRLGRITP
jgi:hypothetical protein